MKYTEYKQQIENDPEYLEAYKAVALHLGLANAVFKARMERGLTQTALAKAIGTKQANISKIESGLGNPTINLIQKLVNFLEINVTFNSESEIQISHLQFTNNSSRENSRIFHHRQEQEISYQPYIESMEIRDSADKNINRKQANHESNRDNPGVVFERIQKSADALE
jgi:transcriptional regulator with XRE-family HTH domain